jgi:hypothetical protein
VESPKPLYALQHIKGLVRIRHYGFLANACRSKQLPRIRQAIAAADKQEAVDIAEKQASATAEIETVCFSCPNCHRPMRILAVILPARVRFEGG